MQSEHLVELEELSQGKDAEFIEEVPVSDSEVIKKFVSLAASTVAGSVLRFMFGFINLYFVGQLNDPAMTAGLGLGVTFTAFFGLTILIGTNCAQETLTSHAFGAKELRRCGVLLNRGRVILTAVYIPIALVFAFSRELLVMIGQDAEVAYHAGEFIKYQIVGIYFIGQFDLTKRWLTQCQVAWVPLIAMIICTVMHVGWCWLYMVHYGLGMLGAGLANATSALIMWIIVTIISLTVSELKDALFWPDRESFSRWGEYLAISIPVTIMICAEVGVFNVFVIMSGYLGVVDQAAQVILMCLNELMFMAALGFMEATCSLVGSSIGAKNVTLAKRISKLTFAVSFSTCMVVLVFMQLLRRQVAGIFTSEPELLNKLVSMIPFLCISYLADSAQGILSGTVRALGMQRQAAIYLMVSLVFVGIPIGIVFAFPLKLGLQGLWLGTAVGFTFEMLSFLKIIWQADWIKVAAETARKMEEAKQEIELK